VARHYLTLIFPIALIACGETSTNESSASFMNEAADAGDAVSFHEEVGRLGVFDVERTPQSATDIRALIARIDASDWIAPVGASSAEVERYRACLVKIQGETRELWGDPTHTVIPETLELASWSDGRTVGLVLASHLSDTPRHNSFLYVLDMGQCRKMFVEYEATQVMVALDTIPQPAQFNLVHHDPDHLLAEYRISAEGRQLAKFSPEQVDAILLKGHEELNDCAQSLKRVPKGSHLSSICDLEAFESYSIRSFTWLRIYDFSPNAAADFGKSETGERGGETRVLRSPAGEAVVTEYFHTNRDPYLIEDEFLRHITTK